MSNVHMLQRNSSLDWTAFPHLFHIMTHRHEILTFPWRLQLVQACHPHSPIPFWTPEKLSKSLSQPGSNPLTAFPYAASYRREGGSACVPSSCSYPALQSSLSAAGLASSFITVSLRFCLLLSPCSRSE